MLRIFSSNWHGFSLIFVKNQFSSMLKFIVLFLIEIYDGYVKIKNKIKDKKKIVYNIKNYIINKKNNEEIEVINRFSNTKG